MQHRSLCLRWWFGFGTATQSARPSVSRLAVRGRLKQETFADRQPSGIPYLQLWGASVVVVSVFNPTLIPSNKCMKSVANDENKRSVPSYDTPPWSGYSDSNSDWLQACKMKESDDAMLFASIHAATMQLLRWYNFGFPFWFRVATLFSRLGSAD